MSGRRGPKEPKDPNEARKNKLIDSLSQADILIRNLQQESKVYNENIRRIQESIKFERKKKEDKMRDLNDLECQMNDLINKNQIEVKSYKERVKDIICNDQMRVNAEVVKSVVLLKMTETDNRHQQLEIKRDVDILNRKIREKETMLEQHLVSQAKQKFEEWRDKRLDIERDLNELKAIYGNRIDELRNQMDEQRKQVIANLEEEYEVQVTDIIRRNDEKFKRITDFFRAIKDENMKNIQKNKKAVKEKKEQERGFQKALAKNKRDIDNRKKPREENEERLKRKNRYVEELKKLKSKQNQMIEDVQKKKSQIKDIEYELELRYQQRDQLQKEFGALEDKVVTSLVDVRQRTGLEQLILERKLEALRENVEKKDAELSQILSSANLDPNKLGQLVQSIEEIESRKAEEIALVQEELKKIREAHSNMVKTYENKLAEYGIPVEELGFDPLVPANI